MYDLIIIGGGPAGITAGIYASRKKLKTAIIAKDFSGQTAKAAVVENWPGIKTISGPELMDAFRNHLGEFEIDVVEGEVVIGLVKKENGFLALTDGKKEYEARAVIIASGRNPRPLKIPGEQEYSGKGVSYCVTCDGPLFYKKNVAILGGGNSGAEAAIEMSRNCPKVYLLEIGPRLLADKSLQEEVRKRENIEILLNAAAREIKGNAFVESLVYAGRETKEEKEIDVRGVFVEIGSVPVTDFAKDLVDCNKSGELKIDHATCKTKTPGIFAAGDVTNVLGKQIVIASGEGAKAALSAYKYLSGMNADN